MGNALYDYTVHRPLQIIVLGAAAVWHVGLHRPLILLGCLKRIVTLDLY